MTHALIAISSSVITAYMLIPPTGDGGYHFGLILVSLLSGFCAAVLEVTK